MLHAHTQTPQSATPNSGSVPLSLASLALLRDPPHHPPWGPPLLQPTGTHQQGGTKWLAALNALWRPVVLTTQDLCSRCVLRPEPRLPLARTFTEVVPPCWENPLWRLG